MVTGFGFGSVFDGVGQVVKGEEFRLGQMLTSGVTGAVAYPLAGTTLLGNAFLGSAVGGTNTAVTNYIYGRDDDVARAVRLGFVFGGLATYLGGGAASASAALLPRRVGAELIDPARPILMQNIGVLNPYPAYIGEAVGGAVGGIPSLNLLPDATETKP